MKRVALYGGSFDPPHLGHVITTSATLNSGLVDQVWLVPSGVQRRKRAHADDEQRRDMIAIMLATVFGSKVPVFLNTVQMELGERMVSTFELLEHFKRIYPRTKFLPVIGSDLCADLKYWHESKKLLKRTTFLVMPRPGFPVRKPYPKYLRVLRGETLALTNISSSMVRELIHKRRSLEGVVPPAVISHIIRNRLYGYKDRPR